MPFLRPYPERENYFFHERENYIPRCRAQAIPPHRRQCHENPIILAENIPESARGSASRMMRGMPLWVYFSLS
jgi:hypothetical protein